MNNQPKRIFNSKNLPDIIINVLQKDVKKFRSQTKDNLFGGYKHSQQKCLSVKKNNFEPLYSSLTPFQRKIIEQRDSIGKIIKIQKPQQRKDLYATDIKWNDIRYQNKNNYTILDTKYQAMINLKSSDIFKAPEQTVNEQLKRLKSFKVLKKNLNLKSTKNQLQTKKLIQNDTIKDQFKDTDKGIQYDKNQRKSFKKIKKIIYQDDQNFQNLLKRRTQKTNIILQEVIDYNNSINNLKQSKKKYDFIKTIKKRTSSNFNKQKVQNFTKLHKQNLFII